jgi:hypothetical protein
VRLNVRNTPVVGLRTHVACGSLGASPVLDGVNISARSNPPRASRLLPLEGSMTRSRAFGLCLTLASLAATMSLAGGAAAESPAKPLAYVPAAQPVDTAPDKAEDDYKHVTLQANPLSAIIGRYGIDVAYLPALHHGIVINPFYSHVSVEATNANGATVAGWSLSGFGGEVGYRFYSGERGANGFYVGPSFIFASYKQSVTGADSLSFTNMGAALDVGGQAIIGGGFTIGGGFGLQYTKTSVDLGTIDKFAANALAGGGLRPRVLFTLGYSF